MMHRRQSREADVYFATTRGATRKTLVSCIGVRERGSGAVINFAVMPPPALPSLLRSRAAPTLQVCIGLSRIAAGSTMFGLDSDG